MIFLSRNFKFLVSANCATVAYLFFIEQGERSVPRPHPDINKRKIKEGVCGTSVVGGNNFLNFLFLFFSFCNYIISYFFKKVNVGDGGPRLMFHRGVVKREEGVDCITYALPHKEVYMTYEW